MKSVVCAAAVALAAGAASAQTIDGTNFDSEYGAALWTQNLGTQFGNNNDAGVDSANGSEIDGVFASISGTTLYLGVSGNLETNFNKINIALDFMGGGQNTLSGLANLGNLDGLTFDTGFEADAVLSYTHGNGPLEHYLDGDTAGGGGGFLGGGVKAGPLNATLNGAAISITSDNSNVGGVGAFGDPVDSDPSMVYTGVELSIDLGALGWDGSTPILLAGWINGSGNDFLSNQVIGGMPDGTGNLGGPSGVNFANIAGNQYITIVPAPASAALLGLGGFVAIRRRR
ncbi:MAG: hypothetical protein DHS20C14_14540 [Phycisphaeraceae bacterium]|nr:MAG: hypothetical protein DHS20C14_14540 [Phycisphaeraceae bacterium]